MILSRANYKNVAKMPIPEIKAGVILSGPYLIDNLLMNKLFIQEFVHEAIGIKLERSYLIKAMRQATKNIIAKAVCDFGDGRKNKVYQPTAAIMAADFIFKKINDPNLPPIIAHNWGNKLVAS